ncbi:MAG: AI-2E family transporter [Candidatus Fournierella pullistercoris]|uniref:AI-2E family transporter n=1 Tax=Candidatus Allofournierella pullistercoris TaxID=2838597 RepID=A0A948T1G0_9FIRM|nr:AI-2E family transporter [Candidatus Fournierella pullistercoris]
MEQKIRVRSLAFVAVGCILLYWALQNPAQIGGYVSAFQKLILPFALGGAMAFILNVPMRAIESFLPKKLEKARRPLALVLTLLAVVGVLLVVSLLVVPQLQQTIWRIIQQLPGFWQETQTFLNELMVKYPALTEWLKNPASIDWNSMVRNVIGWMQTSGMILVGNTVNAASSLVSGFVNFFIGFIFAIYLLFGKENLTRQIRMLLYAWTPEKVADRVLEIARLSDKTFSSFLSGQCVEACILGCLFAVGMLLFRMPYVLLISVLVAVTALIPVFGAFVGCFVGAFLILIENPMQAVVFVILFLVIQQIEGNLIYPRVVGGSVGLPAIWVLVAVTIGGSAMGVVGMLVMIPACSVLYSLMRTVTWKRLRSLPISRSKYDVEHTVQPAQQISEDSTTKQN